jgi:hypothetical protein
VARFDTTSFNVYHAPTAAGQADHALLRFGFSKDHPGCKNLYEKSAMRLNFG